MSKRINGSISPCVRVTAKKHLAKRLTSAKKYAILDKKQRTGEKRKMNAPFSLWSYYFRVDDPEAAILEFEKSGISNTELAYEHGDILLRRSGDHIDTGRRFADFMHSHGVSSPQGHLRFPVPFATDPDIYQYLVRQIEMYEAIGVKCAVLHGDYMKGLDLTSEERHELNIEAIAKLMSMIEHVDITICLENLCGVNRGIDELLDILGRVNSSKLGICLDTGHLNLTGTSSHREFILKAGERLKALHIADNDGSGDQHLAPFGRGRIDFIDIMRALREIDYNGLFNYEIGGETARCPLEILHAKAAFIHAGYEYLLDVTKSK